MATSEASIRGATQSPLRGTTVDANQEENYAEDARHNDSATDNATDTDDDSKVVEVRSSRRKADVLDKTLATIAGLGVAAKDCQDQIQGLAGVCNRIGEQFIAHQVETKEQVGEVRQAVVVVDEKVEAVDSKVDKVNERLSDLSSKLSKRDETSSLFIPYLHTLFNGETGVVGLCPVGYEDAAGVMRKVVVASLPLLIWYFERAKEGVRIPELTIRSYFGSGSDLMLYPKFPYSDFIDISLSTPFKTRSIGARGDRNEAWNRLNFLIFEGESVQSTLEQARADFPVQTQNLQLPLTEVRRTHSHGNDGNKIAYTLGGPRSSESGPIQSYGNKSFSMVEKAQIPAMGYSWTEENYSLPYVREFFRTSKAQMCGRHIVGGQVLATSSLVKTHAQEHEKRKPEMVRAMEKARKKCKTR